MIKSTTINKIVFLLFAILFSLNSFSQLSGTYTIGGTSPNYPTIDSAIIALKSNGVSGKVTFHIRQGTYRERVVIDSISGASLSNQIIFKADPGNSSSVFIEDSNSNSSSNYIIQIDGAKHLKFSNLSFTPLDSIYGTAIQLIGFSNYIEFDSCNFLFPKTFNRTGNAAINGLYGVSNVTHNLKVTNCIMNGGTYGIYSRGYSASNRQTNWIIEDNSFLDHDYSAIWLLNFFDSVSIKRNTIKERFVVQKSWQTSVGIYFNQCTNSNIIGNNMVFKSHNAYGMWLNRMEGTSSNPGYVANNMISFTSLTGGFNYGIYVQTNKETKVVFNSISIKSGSGYGIWDSKNSANAYLNNAIEFFSNSATSYGLYLNGPAPTRGYNCINMPVGSASNISLGTGTILKDPGFKSASDLHASSVFINGKGTTVSAITTDIDGHSRGTLPDIGADEFLPAAIDAGISELVTDIVCSGSNDIYVKLNNYGLNALTSVSINWSVSTNGGAPSAKPAFVYSGSLASGKDTTINIGTHNISGFNTNILKVWTSSPNSSIDSINTNDTTTGSILTGLSGSFTVGGSAPDFLTIGDGVAAMKQNGLCGPVTFKIRPGTYNESVVLESGQGWSSTNSVKITRDSSYSGSVNWISNTIPLTIKNAHYITIVDLDMKTSGASSLIYINGGNSYINILKNRMSGYETPSSNSTAYALIRSDGTVSTSNHIRIELNKMSRGSRMVSFYGISSMHDKGNQILYNDYDSAGQYPISIQYQDSVEVIGNRVNDKYGVGTNYAIFCSDNNYYRIESNSLMLYNGFSNGIYLSRGVSNSLNRSKVANNYIHQYNGQYGIYSNNSDSVDFLFNTIRLEGSGTNTYSVYASGKGNSLMNNNINNYANGYAISISQNNVFSTSDFNNIYSNSSTKLALIGSTQHSLASYKSSTSKDANSIAQIPLWLSSEKPDILNLDFNAVGISNYSILTDIYGSVRSVKSDIGCVEMNPKQNDAGAREILVADFCSGSTPAKVKLFNFGTSSLTQARIQWEVSVNGGTPLQKTPLVWTGNLPSFKDTVISLGTFSAVANSTYRITAYVDRANNLRDSLPFNDSTTSGILKPKLSGVLTVGGLSPDFPTLDSALGTLKRVGICAPVIVNIRPGSYAGQNKFYKIPGASTINTITIQTDSSSSGIADLYHSGVPFEFYDAEHYIINNVKVRTTGLNQVVFFKGSTNNIVFEGDSLIGTTSNSTNVAYTIIADQHGILYLQNNLLIKGCVILNGSYGIYLRGNTRVGPYSQNGIEISDCKILNYYRTGVYADLCTGIKVKGNYISDRKWYIQPYGINIARSDSSKILANSLQINKYRGIEVSQCFGDTNTPGVLLANNMVTFIDTLNLSMYYNGIINSGNTFPLIAYNSVRVPSGSSSSACLYNTGGSNQTIKNNNLVNMGKGYAIYCALTSAIVDLDYNNLYSKGSSFGYFNGNAGYLVAWKTKTGTSFSSNTINKDPQFKSYLDLHIQNYDLEGAADPIYSIPKDIDGQIRGTIVNDIGADELPPADRDIGISYATSRIICSGSHAILVNIKNYGLDTLKSDSLSWSVSVNGATPVVQSPYNFSGRVLSQGDTTFSIGNYSFTQGNSYVIKVKSNHFNGLTDQIQRNNTFEDSSLISTYSGWYSVGPSTSDNFSTIQEASDSLFVRGVCAPVFIYVKSGTYLTTTIKKIPGTTLTNTVTFLGDTLLKRPEIKNTVYGIHFKDAQFVKVKNFKVSCTRNPINLSEGGNDIVIDSCELVGSDTLGYLLDQNACINFDGRYTSWHFNNITISNNEFYGGSVYIYDFGGFDTNWVIRNNTMKRAVFGAMLFGSNENLVISENNIDIQPHKNHEWGIFSYSMGNVTINGNHIRSNKVLHTISTGNVNSNHSYKISNNFISASGRDSISAIYTYSYSNYLLDHNSINVFNSDTNSACVSSRWSTISPTNLYLKSNNNSFYNKSGGKVLSCYGLFYSGNGNNYLSTGKTQFLHRYYRVNTLARWKTYVRADTISIAVNPKYRSNTDLHAGTLALRNAGVPMGYKTDIDGESRDLLKPDIGADEINLLAKDVSVNTSATLLDSGCVDSIILNWSFTNKGITAISSMDYSIELWDSSVRLFQSRDTILQSFSTFNSINRLDTFKLLSQGTNYQIRIFIHSTNGSSENDKSNDSLVFNYYYAGPIYTNVLGSDSSICPGDTLRLTTSLIGKYLWGNGDTTVSQSVNKAGVYKLEVTDTNSCVYKDSINLALFTTSNNLGNDTTFCPGDTITLVTSTVGKKYNWNTQDTSHSIKCYLSGIYWLNIIDSNSCSSIDSITVNTYLTSTLHLGTDTSFCPGDTHQVKVQGNFKSYLWNTSDTSNSINVAKPGNYWVMAIDSNSCSSLDSITLNTYLVSVPQLGADTSFCAGDTHVVMTQNNFKSYLWSTTDTSNSIRVTKSGSFWVRTIDSNSCFGSDSVRITTDSLPMFNFGPDTSICSFDSLVLYPNAPGAKYQWLSGDTSAFVLVDSSGVYGLTVRDSNGCYFSDSINITIDSVPLVNLGPDTSFCGSNLFILRSSVNVKSYLWNTGDTIDTLALNKGGSYWLLVKDSNNCVGSDTVLVSYKAICVGIDESFLKNTTINYYPNPNSGTFNLNLNSDFNGEVKLIVRNMQGQIVSSESWLKTEKDMIREINLNDHPSGVYFLDLITPLGKAQHRITINK